MELQKRQNIEEFIDFVVELMSSGDNPDPIGAMQFGDGMRAMVSMMDLQDSVKIMRNVWGVNFTKDDDGESGHPGDPDPLRS